MRLAALDALVRTSAWDRAVRAVVEPESIVVSVGPDLMPWAILAARLGARVFVIDPTPWSHVANHLARANGVTERVRVIRELNSPVSQPADVILVDPGGIWGYDGDAQLITEASRWAGAETIWVPRAVSWLVAPAEVHIPAMAALADSFYGLDLSPLRPYAANALHPVQTKADPTLGTAATVHTASPPDLGPFAKDIALSIERGGHLAGLVLWVDCELCDGISVSSAPGVADAHQVFLALPDGKVAPGDQIIVSVVGDLDGVQWEGEVRRGIEPPELFSLESDPRIGERARPSMPRPPDPGPLAPIFDRLEADPAGVRAQLDEVLKILPPSDSRAAECWEVLGKACYELEDYSAACRALMRAVDSGGDLREPALRALVLAMFRAGRPEAEATLQRYETAFGPHPYVPR